MSRRAAFIDKDGTLIDNMPYNVDPSRVRLANGAGDALRQLRTHGYSLIVISNQPGVALGRFPLQALAAVEQRIQELLRPSGVAIDAFYYCPHLPQAPNVRYAVRCLCRKPQPGLLRRAARERDVALADSWLVGDILDDVEAGNRAGCRTVLVDVGNETEWQLGPQRQPHLIARSLQHAVSRILAPPARATKDADDATGVASGA